MRDAPVRSVFLVGGDGMIREVWRYEPHEVPDVEDLLEAARSLS
jgi:peroxiredoxin